MKGRVVLGRPAPLWILAVLGTIGGLLSTIVAMQFAEVIPWAGEEASYIGGRWTGVVAYALVAGLFFGAAYAWITVKPWAHMVSILGALIGFFIPFMSYMDGTDPRSSAIAPIVPSVLMLFMVFRPSTNRAMAAALSGQGTVKSTKTPPPPKPMSAARKRELAAEEQKKAKSQASIAAVSAPTSQEIAAPSVATIPAAPPAVAAAPAPPAKTAASMVLSAASSLKAAAATPASPRKGVTYLGPRPASQPAAPASPAQPIAQPVAQATAPALPANQPRPPGFRADEV
jgi:hypothetical protein